MEPIKNFIGALSKEKDLDLDVIREAIENAMNSAAKKNPTGFRDARPELDVDGTLTVYVTKTVVEDEDLDNSRQEIGLKEARKLFRKEMLFLPEDANKVKAGIDVEVEIEPADFGRIAAQSAKQVIAQRLRDAERQNIYNDYKNKVGDLVTGLVQRFERRDVILNIGRAEGVMPLREQPFGTKYRIGDRLKVLITDVRESPKGPQITLSRKTPELVIRLFEQEVPEISEGIVKIISVARESGVRTKIAVTSSRSDVDPVGACVGMKGSRVQMVVRELENERIDIVPFSANPATFISNALDPAKIKEIFLNEEEKRAEVVVAEGNLAIAIGRKGQNTKLAARLSGWTLDVRGDEEEGLEFEEAQKRYLEDFVGQISGLASLGRDALLKSQYNTVEKIARAEPQTLVAFTNDDPELAERLVKGAAEYLEALRELQAGGEMMAPPPEEGEEDLKEGAEEGSDEDADEATAKAADSAGEQAEESGDPPEEGAGEAGEGEASVEAVDNAEEQAEEPAAEESEEESSSPDEESQDSAPSPEDQKD